MKPKTYRNIIQILFSLFVAVIILGGSYTAWNAANPEKTCASCHEISPSHQTWASSAHRDISCFKCHGTALENGWHSLSEKTQMVFKHIESRPRPYEIYLTENQLLETMERCINCHQDEYTNWLAGGHSMTYSAMLLDETHNSTEQLNFDCLRCHGMFYAGTVEDLVEPISRTGPWKMKIEKMADKPVIPCLTCHEIHTHGETATRPDYSSPNNIFYSRTLENNSIGFYIRNEKMHMNLANLPTPVILAGTDTVQTTSDPAYRLCVQCHAPDVWHQSGTSDDQTPTGVHEGISCRACHEPHSNFQRNSCDKCHTKISQNCKLDVRTMNTTYFSPASENDIHFVSCQDCHPDMIN
jgi:hypothetical protein